MKILIADDEVLARQRLKEMLAEEAEMEIVAEAADGRQALSLCDQLQPDLVLLDIRMPGMSGLEVARHLVDWNQRPAVIFVTAFDEHALEAFDTHAMAYLLKPIRKQKLLDAIERAQHLTRAQVAGLSEEGEQQGRSHISCRIRGALQLIPVNEIYYFLADQKYVTVYHSQGEALIEESLKSLESDLNERFVRVHRNALVARERLMGMEKHKDGRYTVVLEDVQTAPEISRRHVAEIRRLLKERAR